jgi:hypothetical protein
VTHTVHVDPPHALSSRLFVNVIRLWSFPIFAVEPVVERLAWDVDAVTVAVGSVVDDLGWKGIEG